MSKNYFIVNKIRTKNCLWQSCPLLPLQKLKLAGSWRILKSGKFIKRWIWAIIWWMFRLAQDIFKAKLNLWSQSVCTIWFCFDWLKVSVEETQRKDRFQVKNDVILCNIFTFRYRNCAIKGLSRLVAGLLKIQAKTGFLGFFVVTSWLKH